MKQIKAAILMTSASRAAGGLFNSVRLGAAALVEAGCEISVFCLSDAHTRQDLPQWAPLQPRTFASLGPPSLGIAPKLGRALDETAPDLLHQHGLWSGLSVTASQWRRRTKRPVVISPRGMLDPWALANSAWKKRIARTLFEDANLRGAACLHALTEAEARAFRRVGLKNPIAIIPNGTDLPNLETSPAPPPDFFGADGRKTMLFLGRIHPKKGIAELLRAWALLRQSCPACAAPWRLVIAGWDDGGHLDALRKLAADLELTDHVMFPGPVFGADKEAAFRCADAFILPSHSEGLPMAVLEAWSYELPVFMTRACNLAEGFENGAAIEVTTDPKSLANVLGDHLASENLSAMGVKGRALVKERYCWNNVAADLHAVYAWLVHGGSPPANVLFD